MARLQILELPTEHHGDDMVTPFVLVIDQHQPRRYVMDLDQTEQPVDELDSVAEKIGARAVLAFEETVEIPANNPAAPVDDTFKAEVATWATGTNETLARIIEAVSGQKRRKSNPVPRPGTDSGADADRELAKREDVRRRVTAECKNSLAEALGVDHTRDWDDIRNAAVGLREQCDAQVAELERLRAGEEPVTDNRVTPTPAQWIWHWNWSTPEKRLSMAGQILTAMATADVCFAADHEVQIATLRAEVGRLRGEPSTADTPDA